jgi:hypothetical protein
MPQLPLPLLSCQQGCSATNRLTAQQAHVHDDVVVCLAEHAHSREG